MALLPNDSKPPVHLWHPERETEIDMRIARDGSWFYQGSKIDRHRMVKLFSTILRRDGDRYFLVTPVEKVAIQVDDVPFTAVEMTVHGAGEEQIITFRTNVDDEIMAGPDHPIRVAIDVESEEPSPYIHVRDRLDALMTRPVFYELVNLADDSDSLEDLGLWSAGVYFDLSK